jgi:ribosome recycling factor
MPTIEEIKDDAMLSMDNAVDSLKKRFDSVRTGKASPALVDGIMVDYYGAQSRLKDIASVSAPEPRVLKIQPWDVKAVDAIKKAIMTSSLGITPLSDGKVIRLPIPELSEERRTEMTKQVKKYAEEARVEIRNARRDANEAIKNAKKKSEITEDDQKSATDEIQKMTDKMIEKVDKILDEKQNELMSV